MRLPKAYLFAGSVFLVSVPAMRRANVRPSFPKASQTFRKASARLPKPPVQEKPIKLKGGGGVKEGGGTGSIITANILCKPINELCHVIYVSSWQFFLGTSYAYCRFQT